MLKLFWTWLEPETKRTILIIAPILILGFLALVHIHPLVTIGCVLLMAMYGVGFFAVELSRECIVKLKKRWNARNYIK